MRPRTRAVVVWGGIAVGTYLAGALVSAHLSPFARRPLLDGLAPVAPYRWVSPPPSAAATNKPPTPGRFTLPITRDGVRGGAFATQDVQVTVIVPNGAFSSRPGQRSILLTVVPLAPSEVAPAPRSLVLLGNVVRLDARYQPSGAPVTRLAKPIEVVLLYPFVPTDSGRHVLLSSADGTSWSTVKATDHVASAQLLAPMRTLGDVAAAGTRAAARPSAGPGSSAYGSVAVTAAIVAGAALLILALFLLFGRRRPGRSRG
jgi:hypothetical protein